MITPFHASDCENCLKLRSAKYFPLVYNSIPFVKHFFKKVANSHKKQLFLNETRTDDEIRRECWDAVIPVFPPFSLEAA
jgi:hypothetical protein